MSVLVTNYGNTHPPETWAAATASTIFDAGAGVASGKRIEAMKFQASLAELLVAHHAAVQED